MRFAGNEFESEGRSVSDRYRPEKTPCFRDGIRQREVEESRDNNPGE